VSSPPVTGSQDPFQQAPPVHVRTIQGLVRTVAPTAHFLMETEAHVYAFSIAANVLLSFFPFLLTIILICRSVLHWEAGVQAILFAVSQCFPDYHGGIYIDISGLLNQAAWAHRRVSWLSLLLLFFTANGIFEPLEVALNRAWQVAKNRSFFKNQLVSLALIFFCGILILVSTIVVTWHGALLTRTFGGNVLSTLTRATVFKLVTLPLTSIIIFVIYWALPNRKIPARRLIPASVIVAIFLTALNYVNLLTWPWLLIKLKGEVGPFVHSVSILLWSFFAALIVLAGAEWSARVTLGSEPGSSEEAA
jgi:membrane protein